MDSELKKQMESVCADLGINMTTAFIMLAKKMVREQRIPFDVSIDPFYLESNMKHLPKQLPTDLWITPVSQGLNFKIQTG